MIVIKYPLFVRISIVGTLIFIIGAFIVGFTAHSSQFYLNWVWYGSLTISMLAVSGGISWLPKQQRPSKFFLYSLLTAVLIIGTAIIVSFALPEANLLQLSDGKSITGDGYIFPAGTVTDTEHIKVFVPLVIFGIPALGVSFILTLLGMCYILVRKTKKTD